MTEPKISPFKLTKPRIVLLIFGALIVLIGLSTAMGGMSGYHQLKTSAAPVAPADPAPQP